MAKNRLNGWTKWVIFAVSMALIVAAWIWQASTIASRVEANCAEIMENKKEVVPVVRRNELAVEGIKKDINYLTKTVEENMAMQQQILILQNDTLNSIKNLTP